MLVSEKWDTSPFTSKSVWCFVSVVSGAAPSFYSLWTLICRRCSSFLYIELSIKGRGCVKRSLFSFDEYWLTREENNYFLLSLSWKMWGFIHRHNREIKNRFGTTFELLMTSQFDPVKKWNIPDQAFKPSIALTYHVIRDTLHLGKTKQNDMSRH